MGAIQKAAMNAIAEADAHLNNVGLPTYSELNAALNSAAWAIDLLYRNCKLSYVQDDVKPAIETIRHARRSNALIASLKED